MTPDAGAGRGSLHCGTARGSSVRGLGTDVVLAVHLALISFSGEEGSLDDLIGFTETARDLGYTHLCVNDHLVVSRPWLDGPTALAAVLAHSGQMTLATTVSVPELRGPPAT